jgi:hypothetical protein
LRKKVAGFLAAMSIFGGKGGVEANEIPTQYRGDTTGQNQKSSDNEQTPNSSTYTKVGADFSPANTSPETPSSPENEGPVDIIGEYKLKEGEGFYIGAKKALRDALAKPGVDESIVYAQIVEEYGLDSALLNDPKKLQEIWAKRQGERIEYGIHPNKGGGYRYKITLDPDARFRVYLQDYRSRFAPVVEVTDGMSRHEEKTHETFSVGPENAKKTFHIGQEVTYKTKSGKKGIYSIVGPSLDTNLGLILRELGTNREFAISGDALPRVEEADNKEVSEKEAPLRLETPRVNIQDREEVPVNGVDLNPTPADAPTPEDESGLKPIDTGRPPAMKTYSVNSDFPKSETRVRKEPNSVEEALLGNGTIPEPEKDPARARAMIAWHELDMTLDRVLPDRTAYAEVQKEMLELTTQFLEKDESTQLLTLERIFKTLEQKANAVETAQRAARPRVSLLQRFFDGRRKRDSRAEEYRKVVNSITEEIRIAVDHLDITPPNLDSDVAKTGQ